MLYNYKNKKTYCRCLCDCGTEHIVNQSHLVSRPNISCGCMSNYYRTIHNRSNEIGQKYGRLTIIDIDYSYSRSKALCLCECGNVVLIDKTDVVCGHTKSCGCLQSENASNANTKDLTGVVSDCGVLFIDKAYQDEHRLWHWNCKCPICGNIFQALPIRVLRNITTSCGCKILSSRERAISNILDDMNLTYEKQKRFPDCKYKYTLPFDFAVYYNDNMFLIEYDGQQHFKAVDFFDGEKGYIETHQRDMIKSQYCMEHNIPLLRLNYKDSIDDMRNKITNIINP